MPLRKTHPYSRKPIAPEVEYTNTSFRLALYKEVQTKLRKNEHPIHSRYRSSNDIIFHPSSFFCVHAFPRHPSPQRGRRLHARPAVYVRAVKRRLIFSGCASYRHMLAFPSRASRTASYRVVRAFLQEPASAQRAKTRARTRRTSENRESRW